MRVSSLSLAIVRNAPEAGSVSAPAPVAPATVATVAAPAKPAAKASKRVVNVKAAKPAAKPAPVAAKPAKPAAKPADAPAKPSANVNRTIATIAAQACNFGGVVSTRDEAYLAFYASFAKAARDGVATVRAIAESGRKPAYNGSNKPHDAGVVQRLHKAGIINAASDGSSFRFTDLGRKHKAYASAK
jgi:hypothetical protein